MLFSGGRKNGTKDGRKNSFDNYLHLRIFNVREDGERQESGTIGEEERDCEEGKGRKVTGENMLHFLCIINT